MLKGWKSCVNNILLYSLTASIDFRYRSNEIDGHFNTLTELTCHLAKKINKIFKENKNELSELYKDEDNFPEFKDLLDDVISEMKNEIPIVGAMHGDDVRYINKLLVESITNLLCKLKKKK